MATVECNRCDKVYNKADNLPDYIICETEPCTLYTSGYAMYELDLCPDCTEALKKFMMGVGENGDNCRES